MRYRVLSGERPGVTQSQARANPLSVAVMKFLRRAALFWLQFQKFQSAPSLWPVVKWSTVGRSAWLSQAAHLRVPGCGDKMHPLLPTPTPPVKPFFQVGSTLPSPNGSAVDQWISEVQALTVGLGLQTLLHW